MIPFDMARERFQDLLNQMTGKDSKAVKSLRLKNQVVAKGG